MNFVATSGDKIETVRECLEKMDAQGGIGTIDVKRCIQYLRDVETDMSVRGQAIRDFKAFVLGLD